MAGSRKLSRRSFVAAVLGGGAVTGAAALVLGRTGGSMASANGITDSDVGRLADTAAHGRGTPRGYTDADAVPIQDPRLAGRGPGARSGGAPAERNGGSPTAASIRAPASGGCSDADVGMSADAGGRGRACVNRRS